MKNIFVRCLFCFFSFVPISHASQTLDEITITAEPLENSVLQLPNSVSVIDNQTIARKNAQHLEDLLALAPNVNFSTGASRGRFIQIRGIGERSEFQDPIINSVGILIDGIDFTGIATAATTLDIQQVEIFRGPQGTLHGANALAGLVNIVSNPATSDREQQLTLSFEDYNGIGAGFVSNGAVSKSTAYRVALKHYQSDGFYQNTFLERSDTNNIDETTARLKINSQISDQTQIDFTAFIADIDNGYDAFSLDNTRNTLSDQPGTDKQKTYAGSIKLNHQISNQLLLQALVSTASSDLVYSYDEDWSHTGICENTDCDSDLFGFDWFYSSFDQYNRDNTNNSVDMKLISDSSKSISWVTGLYHRDQSIDLLRNYTFADADFSSQQDTHNTAAYGQINLSLSSQWVLSTGFRYERYEVDYRDNSPAQTRQNDNLWGGRIALKYNAASGNLYYGLISRGYKVGGFNLSDGIPNENRQFDSETMVNYELGIKGTALEGDMNYQIALFYQDRKDVQTRQSIVRSIADDTIGGVCPCNFTDFTGNAASGTNQGIELELQWQLNDSFALFGSLGLLDSKFGDFLTFEHIEADPDNGIAFNLAGRDQSHAPTYQASLGAKLLLTEALSVSGSIEAKDDFFFSDRHSARSNRYELLNLKLSYQQENWSVALYGKNLTNQLITTRGFGSFGNDPRNFYTTEEYNQFGTPRLIGIEGQLNF